MPWLAGEAATIRSDTMPPLRAWFGTQHHTLAASQISELWVRCARVTRTATGRSSLSKTAKSTLRSFNAVDEMPHRSGFFGLAPKEQTRTNSALI